MFSRFHHRRAPSTPSSPLPDQLAAWDAAATHDHHHHQQSPPSPQFLSRAQHEPLRPQSSSSVDRNAAITAPSKAYAASPSPTAASAMPPSLPPIARVASVASVYSDHTYDFLGEPSPSSPDPARISFSAPSPSVDTRRPLAPSAAAKSISPQMPQSPDLGDTGFIGGVALANLRRAEAANAQDPSTVAAAAAAAAAASKTAAARPSSSAGHNLATSNAAGFGAATRAPASQTYGVPERRLTRSKPPPPPINTNLASRPYPPAQYADSNNKMARPPAKPASSFVTPTDLHSSAAAAAAAAASASAASAATAANNDPHGSSNAAAGRAKKGLPFLMKNSMSSLLNRRKTSQNTPDLSSLSMSNTDAPVYAPIRGTRVHDFSAPRPRRVVQTDSGHGMAAAAAAAAAAASAAGPPNATPGLASSSTTSPIHSATSPIQHPSLPDERISSSTGAKGSTSTSPQRRRQQQLRSEQLSEPQQQPSYSSSRDSSVTPDAVQNNLVSAFSRQALESRGAPQVPPLQHALQTLQENRQVSFEGKPLPERPAAQESARNSAVGGPASVRSTSTRSRAVSADMSSLVKSTPSTATSHSQNRSLSDFSPNPNATTSSTSATTPASVVSVPPRPMKSTSSRFSFMVGSASEEKLLEERHRQKQLEKKGMSADKPADEPGTRDSRFDDFDEDFDYDAMMDDDGLEERIPGVNADADDSSSSVYEDEIPYVSQDYEVEEEEIPVAADDDPEGLDPNNDQENFAGFVFQRSNASSSLVTPVTGGMVMTPRDATGKVIGFAMTKDTTPDLHPPSTSPRSPIDPKAGADMNGTLDMEGGSHGLGIQHMPLPDQHAEHLQLEQKRLSALEAQQDWQEQRSSVDWSPQAQAQHYPGADPPPPPAMHEDELYFDQGLADELDFGEPDPSSAPFDESIFDNDDTDQYGRPIPGAFALAKAQREMAVAATTASIKRESDPNTSSHISELSQHEQSQHTQSTARTSMSAGGLPLGAPPSEQTDFSQDDGSSMAEGQERMFEPAPTMVPASVFAAHPKEDSLSALRRQLPPLMTDAQRVAAYQAALAEAAYKAAASGKFRRDSSPPPVSPDLRPPGPELHQDSAIEESIATTSPTAAVAATSDAPEKHTHLAFAFTSHNSQDYDNSYDDNYDDNGFQDMDDYDFDDSIIAEANAEALANDSDGFYGQEFNFYSAPMQTHHHSGSGSSGTAEVEYANGGYFVPTGVGRSISGRVVSREPNLTPITERSEYSNRNSVLSLGLPPLGSSADIRSPGLAQLAMLSDDSDMNLSALMRLRNKTFGGSQASLPLSSREGSPKAGPDRDREGASSPWGFVGYPDSTAGSYNGGVSGFLHQHARKNSASSFTMRGNGSGRNSDAGSDSGSPTLTNFQPLPMLSPSPVPPPSSSFNPSGSAGCPPVQEEEDETVLSEEAQTGSSSLAGSGLWMRMSGSHDTSVTISSPLQTYVASPTTMLPPPPPPPTEPAPPPPPTEAPPPPPVSSRRLGGGHRHKGSADSISYTKEEDSGETRWVMERRRTADSGEVEILEREVVEGGRI